MRRFKLFLIGLIPFILGFIMNAIMMQNPNFNLPYKLIGVLSLVIWGFIGFKTCEFGKTSVESAMIVNLPAFLVLLLNLFQEIILGQYWFNIVGISTQFFYLPLINLSFSFTFWSPYLWTVYIVGFLLMFASYYIGAYLKKRSL
ncbi:MAG: hypothetical protein PHC45_03250 [Clostridiaceae bacterium]|nr:hypothetical protein [Clostridiaceae bacterium]